MSAVYGNIDWGSFTGNPNGGNCDFITVAYQLARNFGAFHTHDNSVGRWQPV